MPYVARRNMEVVTAGVTFREVEESLEAMKVRAGTGVTISYRRPIHAAWLNAAYLDKITAKYPLSDEAMDKIDQHVAVLPWYRPGRAWWRVVWP